MYRNTCGANSKYQLHLPLGDGTLGNFVAHSYLSFLDILKPKLFSCYFYLLIRLGFLDYFQSHEIESTLIKIPVDSKVKCAMLIGGTLEFSILVLTVPVPCRTFSIPSFPGTKCSGGP